jgi:hypothetical protein
MYLFKIQITPRLRPRNIRLGGLDGSVHADSRNCFAGGDGGLESNPDCTDPLVNGNWYGPRSAVAT